MTATSRRFRVRAALALTVGTAVVSACDGSTGPQVPATLEAVGTPSVTGRVRDVLPGPFTVRVLDNRGHGVPRVAMACTVESGGGTVSNPAPTTATDGTASCGAWTLGTIAGSQVLAVSVTPATTGSTALAPFRFTATAAAGAPTSLALVAGGGVTVIRSGVPLETAIALQLRDAYNNDVPASGITVTVSVNNATVSGGSAATNATGRAQFAALRINGIIGPRTLSFSASDATLAVPSAIPIALAAGLAARLAIVSTMPANVQNAAPVSPALRVQLRDADGNDVPQSGIDVTATVSGATVTGGVVTTDAQGAATFAALVITGPPGALTLTVSATGLASPAGVSFLLYNMPVALALDVGVPLTLQSGLTVTPPPVVSLRDAAGAVVALGGVVVTVSTTAPGVSLQGTSVATDATGHATFASLGITGTPGPVVLTFQAPGLTSVSAPPSTLQAPEVTPASLEFGTGVAKVLIVDPSMSVPTPPVVVRNAAGTAIPGAVVNYTSRSAAIATVGADGLVTAGESGRTTIVASSVAVPSVMDSIAVHVTRSAAGPLVLTDLTAFTLSAESSVDVRVMFDSRIAGPLSALTVDVAYPRASPALLRLVTTTPAANTSAVASPTAGLVRLVFINSSGQSGVVELATLRFTTLAGTPSFSQIVLNPLQVISATLQDITGITTAINPLFAIR